MLPERDNYREITGFFSPRYPQQTANPPLPAKEDSPETKRSFVR